MQKSLEKIARGEPQPKALADLAPIGEKISGPDLSMEAKFKKLASDWKKARGVSSSLTFMKNLPAYREIIGMGMPVVPLIMRELEQQPDFWFAALREITKENPVPAESAGKLRDMANAWLQWGRTRFRW